MAKKIKGISPFGMHDYQAQDDMHTLMRAHEIRKDPKRHKAAKAHAKKKLAEMHAVAKGGDAE